MEKLQKLFGKQWAEELSPFLRSVEFEKIGKAIKEIQIKKGKIVPELQNIFRPFLECPFHKMHTLILAGGPYVGMDVEDGILADGLALSARRAKNTPNVLKCVIDAIVDEVYNNEVEESMLGWDNDLTYLANDGVLLLNTGLTAVLSRASTEHIHIWKPFISFVVRLINLKKDSVGVILMGDYAQSYQYYLDNPTFAVYKCEHPNESMYRNKIWKSGGVFGALNAYHKHINNIHIKW